MFEGDRNINVESISNEAVFYVYGYAGVIVSFTNPAKAVNLASSIAGIVTNNQGVYLYERSNRLVKNQIMAFVEEKVDEDRNSIAVCLDAMLRKEGVMRSTSVFLEQGQSVLEILNNNLEKAQILDLTGCNMDAVLYYPNIEIPVLALLEDGNAVLIVGYNDKNVLIFEPTSGKIYKK